MWMLPPAPTPRDPPPPKKKQKTTTTTTTFLDRMLASELTVYMLMYCKRARLLSSHPQLFIYSFIHSFIHLSWALEDGTYMIKYENQTIQSAVTAVSMYGKGMF